MVAKPCGATHIRGMTLALDTTASTPTSTQPPPAVFKGRTPLEPRLYSGVNWEGLKTLYLKEVRRFWKVGMQTVFAPVTTTLLYMMVFVVAMRGARPTAASSFAEFVGPGLIMMSILNNAFANSSSSLLQAKIMGTSPDFLTPPLSAFEQTAAFALGAATRGIFVGMVTAVAVWPFSHYHFVHLWAALYFGVAGSLLLGLVGMLTGIWAEKFDHLATVTNFVVMPLTFLSGTFYSVDRLPEPFRSVSHFNPLFYLIDGFRYAFLGTAAGNVAIGVVVSGVLTAILAGVSWWLFKIGWRLKT